MRSNQIYDLLNKKQINYINLRHWINVPTRPEPTWLWPPGAEHTVQKVKGQTSSTLPLLHFLRGGINLYSLRLSLCHLTLHRILGAWRLLFGYYTGANYHIFIVYYWAIERLDFIKRDAPCLLYILRYFLLWLWLSKQWIKNLGWRLVERWMSRWGSIERRL